MADRKISDLTALTTPASGDFLPIVDISEAAAASKNKRITIEELMRGMPDGTAAAPGIAFETDPNTGIYSPGADQVAISTAGTGRLFVDATGNVATGAAAFPKAFTVTNPNAAIELRANSGGAGFTAYSDHGLFFAVDTVKYAQIYNDGIGQLIFRTGSGLSERLRITSAGNVGIGTSAPTDLLHVNGGQIRIQRDVPQILFRSGDGTSNQYYVGANISDAVDGGFVIGEGPGITGGTPRIVISAAGNVGIGTSSPAVALEVRSASNQFQVNSGAANSAYGLDAGAGYCVFKDFSDASEAIQLNNAGFINFTTASAERARIDASGRLLVGASSARNNFFNSTSFSPVFQVEGANSATTRLTSLVYGSSNSEGPIHIFAKHRSNSVGGTTVVADGDTLGEINFQGSDGTEFVSGASIIASVDGTPGANDMPGRLIFSTTSDGAATPTERLRITSAGVLQVADAGNIQVGTTTGTKIGTATTQKLGFYNATPVVQPAAVADATTAVDVITQLNDLLAKLRTLGIIAT